MGGGEDNEVRSYGASPTGRFDLKVWLSRLMRHGPNRKPEVGGRFGSCCELATFALRRRFLVLEIEVTGLAGAPTLLPSMSKSPQGTLSSNGEDTAGFCWAALVARALHPVDVQIIEALRWIEQPLSADDLTQLFDGEPSWAVVGHHIRRLSKLDAIGPAETTTTKNIPDIRYRLVQRPRDGR